MLTVILHFSTCFLSRGTGCQSFGAINLISSIWTFGDFSGVNVKYTEILPFSVCIIKLPLNWFSGDKGSDLRMSPACAKTSLTSSILSSRDRSR